MVDGLGCPHGHDRGVGHKPVDDAQPPTVTPENSKPSEALLFAAGRSFLFRRLLFVWGNRRSLVSEPRRQKLTQALRSPAAPNRRFLFLVGPSGHVEMISLDVTLG
jgi:hypothetical protein